MTNINTMGRRGLLQGGAAYAGLASLASVLRAESPYSKKSEARIEPVAKSLIVLWMNGGPSHVDTLDPKKGKTAGPFKSIPTRVPGMRISEHLPGLAEHADKYMIVRGMTSPEGNHQRARFLGHTGYSPNPTVRHPAFAAWIAKARGGRGELPPFVSIAGPAAGAGFLGIEHGPLILRRAGEMPNDIERGMGVSGERFAVRNRALDWLESDFGGRSGGADVVARRKVYARAQRMMRAPALGAFSLEEESEKTRAAYGDSNFGRGCLVARRLIERGTRVVEVTLNGWDTHRDNFARTRGLCRQLDPACSMLLADLAERNLLDETLVLCMGEFGRTPTINANEGRDHHPAAWSLLLAGGGMRKGLSYGETDARGQRVVRNSVTLPNLFATLASQLGVQPHLSQQTASGRPIAVTDNGRPVTALVKKST
jgi:hypothetical protein